MIRSYLKLTKPGIIMGNSITAAAGFFLASKGHIHLALLLATLVGLGLIVACGCALNCYIDRNADKKMQRTKNRPLVKGQISVKHAVVFAILLGISGLIVLLKYTNLLTALTALLGLIVYAALYSPLKYLSVHATLVGSIAGAVPPVVGYCAVSNRLDIGTLLLFAILFLWQMPHFYAIALYRLDDYTAASIPVLPVKKGVRTTKIHTLLYLVAFLIVSILPTILGYTGYIYLTVVTILGLVWLLWGIKGFKDSNSKHWAQRMFQLSLIMITVLCIMLAMDTI